MPGRSLTGREAWLSVAAHLLPPIPVSLQRPGVRAAAVNFGWMAGEKAIRLVLNVGVGFFVARHLGVERWGLLNFALAVVGVVGLLAELGLEGVARRELIRDADGAPRLLVVVRRLRLAGAGLAGVILAGLLLGGRFNAEESALLAIVALTFFQPAWSVGELWFQSRLEARSAMVAQLGALVVGAAARLWLVHQSAGVRAFAAVLVVEMVVAGIALDALARRAGLRRAGVSFDTPTARRLVREAWPLLLSGFAVMLYLRLDAIMLRAMIGPAAVGVYAAAVRFTEIWYFVPGAVAASLLPSLLRARERGAQDYTERLQRIYDLNAALAYSFSIPLALAAPVVIRLAYGDAFAAAVPVLALHIWSSVFVFLGVARSQFLLNEGFTRFYLLATCAGLVVNAGLNWVLISRQGPIGAALATLVAQAVAAWLSSFFFAPLRQTGWMQTRALFIPFTWYRYVFRR